MPPSTTTDAAVEAPARPPASRRGLRRIASAVLRSPRTVLFVLTVGLFTAFAVLNPNFLNAQFVVFPLLREASIFFIVGLAQMCALSIGHMNLAVGRMAAVGAMVAGACYEFLGLPLLLGLGFGTIAGALIGALAGWIIVRSGVNSFVVTLSLDFALLGLVTLIYGSTDAAAFTTKPEGMDFWRNASLADLCVAGICGTPAIAVMVIPALIVGLILQWVYGRARAGRELIATGASIRAAELSGISARGRVILAHTMSGALAGLAGILLGFAGGSFTAAIGNEFMLPSFLAPILGGTALAGGVVSVLGTALGTLFTGVIRMGLSVQGLGVEALNIALGAVLLGALTLQRFRRQR